MAPQQEWKNEQRKWTELQISFLPVPVCMVEVAAVDSFSCFISTSFQLKEKYLSFEALSVQQ